MSRRATYKLPQAQLEVHYRDSAAAHIEPTLKALLGRDDPGPIGVGLPVLNLEVSLLHSSESAAWVADLADARLVRRGNGFLAHAAAGDLVFSYQHAPAFARIELSSPSAVRLYLSDAALEHGVSFAIHFLHPVLEHLLLTHGYFPLHAAACATEAGVGLFFGASGAGKTTLSLALWRAGCSILSEDRPYLLRSGEGLAVLPSFAGAKLSEKTLEMFADSLQNTATLYQHEDKFIYPANQLCRPEYRQQPIVAAYFLDRNSTAVTRHSAVQIDALAARVAFERLLSLELCVVLPEFISQSVTSQQFAILAELVAEVPCFTLSYTDADLAPAAATVFAHLAAEAQQ